MNKNSNNYIKPIKIINLSNPVSKAFQGKYFLGKTKFLMFGNGANAWGGLINPEFSNVNLFIHSFTINNASDTPFLAQIWSSVLANNDIGLQSTMVSNGNCAINPIPINKVIIKYNENTFENIESGLNIYDKLIPEFSSIQDIKNGKLIIPPGFSFIIFFPSIDEELRKSNICFEWWEECY